MAPRGLPPFLLLLLLTLGVPGLGGGHRDPHPEHGGDPHEPPPHLYGDPKGHRDPPKETLSVWVQTLGATLGVSLAPHALLVLVPGDSGTPQRRGLLRGLLSFAAGGLLGDAFLHLIPHALAPHEHHDGHGHSHHGHDPHDGHGHSHHGHDPHDGHGHSHHGHDPHDGHGHSHHGHDPHDGHGHSHHGHGHALSVGLWVLVGIVTFLGVELGVRHCGVRGHGHSHGPKAKVSSSEDEAEDTGGSKGTKGSKGAKGHRKKSPDTERAGLAVSGYLNLAADAAHNFTDGLALGAAFWGGPGRGLLTALTVLLHELPHELGDMALLLRAGCTKGQAMCLQLVTALAAVAGAACSLLAEGSGAAAVSGILPFTAGGFIYLGTVSVIPEILRNSGAGPALLQLLALLAGVAMMLLIAHYE